MDGSVGREAWVVWEENGRYPNFIFELMSVSTRQNDLTTKKDLYAHTFHTHCLLYTSDAADDPLCVDLGGCRIIKKKTHKET